MERKTSTDLLLERLQRTLGAERVILAGLPKLASGADARLDLYMHRTRERIHRLEQIPDVAAPPAGTGETAIGAIIAEFEELFGNAGEEVRKAAATSALGAVRQFMMARYTALSIWAACAGKEQLANALLGMLEDERTLLAATGGVGAEPGKRQKDISLGERLTAMFDRRK
jgi:ferritin-like metal-binding protein YciE